MMHHQNLKRSGIREPASACKLRSRCRRSSRTTARRTSGRICPRYCVTHSLPDISTCDTGNSSSRARVLSGMAIRESPGPAKRRKVCLSPPVAADSATFSLTGRSRVSADHAGALRQAEHIENQRHLAVAHNAGSGKRLYGFELLAERLHDDLFRVVDLVDDQAELAVIGLQHDDVDRRRYRPCVASLRQSPVSVRG